MMRDHDPAPTRPRIDGATTADLCRRWRASLARGEPDHEARNAVVEGHLGLVGLVLKKAGRRDIPMPPDAREALYLHLIQAAGRFDPDRGVRFSTFAVRTLWYGLLMLRGEAGLIRVPRHLVTAGAPIDHLASLDAFPEGPDRLAGPTGADPGDGLDAAERRAVIDRLMAGLPERWAKVVRRRLSGGSLGDAGAEIGVTRERARQIEARSVALMARAAGRPPVAGGRSPFARSRARPARVRGQLLEAVARVLDAGRPVTTRAVAAAAGLDPRTVGHVLRGHFGGRLASAVAEAETRRTA